MAERSDSDQEDDEDSDTSDDIRCQVDPARRDAIGQDPNDPANLPAGRYPTSVEAFSATYLAGLAIEDRYLADLSTGTVFQFYTRSVAVGDLGVSWQGGTYQQGNYNYTNLSAPGSGLTGVSASIGFTVTVGVGGSAFTNVLGRSNYQGGVLTTGVGFDLGLSGNLGWTEFIRAWDVSGFLPRGHEWLREFYQDAWNRECGAGG